MPSFAALQILRRARPLHAFHAQLERFALKPNWCTLTHTAVRHSSTNACVLLTSSARLRTCHQRSYCYGKHSDEPVDEDGESGLEDIARPEETEDLPVGEDHDGHSQYVPEDTHAVPDETPQDEGSTHQASATGTGNSILKLEPCTSPPTRFAQSFSVGTKVYTWHTTAKYGRRLIGPMTEWGQEFTYRTGVSVQWDATYPEKIFVPPSGTPDVADPARNSWYKHRDEVEVTVYFFGSQRAIDASISLIEEMITQEPVLVRVGVFKRQDNGAPPQWLSLRRVNNETRPADIPAISLKTPGKYTLLFETHKEAAVRSVFEETGVRLNEDDLTPTGFLDSMPIEYYWRAKVYYFVAEFPSDAEILGPRTSVSDYFVDWDNNILRQSPDPIDRVWANYADPKTGTAWLTAAKMDELQLPLKGDSYMETRYKVGEHLPELREATQL
ncbi:mitochondrial edited mRNA stability factor 1 [Perkinsela sp. CCAP 1560/4]|nr:mitochondrial edited mRNA stability factor 1 [Perkinsela sp. CCAP 1560/4]|eukprot:KNH08460.1 mitochondrial edited mRNA stability factor 1 [Perkinsela sp. CCAP 1560/4]